MEVPKSEHTCGDLLNSDLIQELSSTKVRAINPHAQRLLAAQVSTANPAKAPPASKAKAKAKAKPKAKASAQPPKDQSVEGEGEGDSPKDVSGGKKRKSKDGGNEPSPKRTEYAIAKQSFFDESLESNSYTWTF